MRPAALYFYIINNGSTVRREEIESATLKQELQHQSDLSFFSYGKQSLEVDCFYRGPFFFYSIPSQRGTLNYSPLQIFIKTQQVDSTGMVARYTGYTLGILWIYSKDTLEPHCSMSILRPFSDHSQTIPRPFPDNA